MPHIYLDGVYPTRSNRHLSLYYIISVYINLILPTSIFFGRYTKKNMKMLQAKIGLVHSLRFSVWALLTLGHGKAVPPILEICIFSYCYFCCYYYYCYYCSSSYYHYICIHLESEISDSGQKLWLWRTKMIPMGKNDSGSSWHVWVATAAVWTRSAIGPGQLRNLKCTE